jgi:hypothetical protein
MSDQVSPFFSELWLFLGPLFDPQDAGNGWPLLQQAMGWQLNAVQELPVNDVEAILSAVAQAEPVISTLVTGGSPSLSDVTSAISAVADAVTALRGLATTWTPSTGSPLPADLLETFCE